MSNPWIQYFVSFLCAVFACAAAVRGIRAKDPRETGLMNVICFLFLIGAGVALFYY